MSTHMKYGGSTIERVMLCPGSVRANAELGDLPAGAAADRGTRIHKRLEELWSGRSDKYTGDYTEDVVATMVHQKIIEVAAQLGFSQGDIRIEAPVVLSHIHPEAGGTVDQFAVQAFGDLFIGDLKTGRKYVSPEMNWQELFYASGVLQSLDEFTRTTIKNIHLVIFQPDSDEPYDIKARIWTFPATAMTWVDEQIKNAIYRSEAEPDNRIAGNHCEDLYCSARSVCSVYRSWLDEKSHGLFSASRNELPPEQVLSEFTATMLAETLEVIPRLKALCKAAEDLAHNALMANQVIPGWKLEDAYGNRVVTDETKLKAALKKLGLKENEYAPRKFESPAGIERLLKAKKIDVGTVQEYFEKPKTGLKLQRGDAKTLEETFTSAEAP